MSLENIFAKPQNIDYAGKIYPVKIRDYDIFKECSNVMYINKDAFDTDKDFYLLDLIVFGMKDKEIINKMENLFTLVFQKESKYFQDDKRYGFVIGEDGIVSNFNYDEVRKVIMKQNLLHELKVFKDPLVQRWANKIIEKRNRDSPNITMEDMITTVSVFKGVDYSRLQDYTIYQLHSDFSRLRKMKAYDASVLAKINGAEKISIEDYAEDIELYKNPYDDLFVKKDKLSNINKAMG